MLEPTFRSTVYGKLPDVFVVIVGITIAFQVDRWKESSDRDARESLYLQGMFGDLEKDMQEYSANVKIVLW